MRTLTNEMDVFTCAAHNDLLSDRKPNEAYCLANPGKEYAVYFPDGGRVHVDLGHTTGLLNGRWLDIARSRWAKERRMIRGGGKVFLIAPGNGHWVLWIVKDP
jgi:hypothetical protein